MLSYIAKSTIVLNYDFVGLLLCSVCLFEFIRRLKIIRHQEILKKISMYSLALYFIHRPILLLFKQYWILQFSNYINVMVYYICTLILSVALIFLLDQSKILKKYLLYRS